MQSASVTTVPRREARIACAGQPTHEGWAAYPDQAQPLFGLSQARCSHPGEVVTTVARNVVPAYHERDDV